MLYLQLLPRLFAIVQFAMRQAQPGGTYKGMHLDMKEPHVFNEKKHRSNLGDFSKLPKCDRIVFWVFLGIIVFVTGFSLVKTWMFTTDDAFITLR